MLFLLWYSSRKNVSIDSFRFYKQIDLINFIQSTRAKYGVKREQFTYSMSLVFVQCIINTLFAIVFNSFITSNEKDGTKSKDTTTNFLYASASICYVIAMVSSNRSLEHVSYPTQVIAKSCKPIPVMIIGVLYTRKSYKLAKYFFVLLIVAGVGTFMYNPNKSSSAATNAYFIGELLLLLSLTMDGFLGAFQDRMKSEHQTKPGKMMFWMNAWSSLILLAALIVTGELWQFISFINKFSFVIWSILQFSIMSAVGQLFIFLTITSFGPLSCSLVTTTRKFFTVLFSVLLFGNSLTGQQWLGTALVFSGLGLDMFFGRQPPKQAKKNSI